MKIGSNAPRLSLDLLRGFHAAARHLSFTKAAVELFVTQSAISQEVKALEEQLGTALFSRANRTLRLTKAGEQLHRAVDQALCTIDGAVAAIAGSRQTLAVTTTVPLASLWLAPRLPEFVRLHPRIGLRVTASNDNLDLARERIDVAIRYAPAGAAPPSTLKLFDYQMFPVCAPALAVSRSRPLRTATDLSRHVWLEFETIRGGRPWFDWMQWLEAKQLRPAQPAGSIHFSHYDQLIDAAIAGSGIAIGKWPYLERQLREGVLVAPLGSEGDATIGSFYVIISEPASDGTQAFVGWLQAEAQRDTEQRRRREKQTAARRPRASPTGLTRRNDGSAVR